MLPRALTETSPLDRIVTAVTLLWPMLKRSHASGGSWRALIREEAEGGKADINKWHN